MPKHRQEEATRLRGKSAPPVGWHAKNTLTSLKMLDVALATPCAFRLVIASFACHSRSLGFLRWVLESNLFENDKRAIVDFRNVLIHEYFGIDEEEVWHIIHKRLPPLKEQVLCYIEAIDRDIKKEMTELLIEENRHIDFIVDALKSLD